MRRGAQENQKQNPASTAKDATGAKEKHKQMFERCKDFSFVFLCARCLLLRWMPVLFAGRKAIRNLILVTDLIQRHTG